MELVVVQNTLFEKNVLICVISDKILFYKQIVLPKYTFNRIFGVYRDTYVFYQSVLEKKRPMNCKFDHCVSQKDVMS